MSAKGEDSERELMSEEDYLRDVAQSVVETTRRSIESPPATHVDPESHEAKKNRLIELLDEVESSISGDYDKDDKESVAGVLASIRDVKKSINEPDDVEARELSVVIADEREEDEELSEEAPTKKLKQPRVAWAKREPRGPKDVAWREELRQLFARAEEIAKLEEGLVYVKDVKDKAGNIVHKAGDRKLTRGGKQQRSLGPNVIAGDESRRTRAIDELTLKQMMVTARHFTWLGSKRHIPNLWNLNPSFTRLRWTGCPVVYISTAIEKSGNSYVAKIIVYYLEEQKKLPEHITPLPIQVAFFTNVEKMLEQLTEVPPEDLLRSYVSLTDEEKMKNEIFKDTIDGIGRHFAFLLPDTVPHPTPTLFGSYVASTDAISYVLGQGFPIKSIRTADVDYFPAPNDRAWHLLPLDKKIAPYVLSPKADPHWPIAQKRLQTLVNTIRNSSLAQNAKGQYTEDATYATVYAAILGTPMAFPTRCYDAVVKAADGQNLGGLNRTQTEADKKKYMGFNDVKKLNYIPLDVDDALRRIHVSLDPAEGGLDEDGSLDFQDKSNILQYITQDVVVSVAAPAAAEAGKISVSPYKFTCDTPDIKDKVDARIKELQTLAKTGRLGDFFQNLTLALNKTARRDVYSKEALQRIEPLLALPYQHQRSGKKKKSKPYRLAIGIKFEEIFGEFDVEMVNLCLSRFSALRLTTSQHKMLMAWITDRANARVYNRLALAPTMHCRAAVAQTHQLIGKTKARAKTQTEAKEEDKEKEKDDAVTKATRRFLRKYYCHDDSNVGDAVAPPAGEDATTPAPRKQRAWRVYTDKNIKDFASVVRDYKEARKQQAEDVFRDATHFFRKQLNEEISGGGDEEISKSEDKEEADIIIRRDDDENFDEDETPLALMAKAIVDLEEDADDAALVNVLVNALDAQMIARRTHFTVVQDSIGADGIFAKLESDESTKKNVPEYVTEIDEVDSQRLDLESLSSSIRRLGLKDDDGSYVYDVSYAVNESNEVDICFHVLRGKEEKKVFLEDRSLPEVLKFIPQNTTRYVQGRGSNKDDFYTTKSVTQRIQSDGGYAFFDTADGTSILIAYKNKERRQNVVVVTAAAGEGAAQPPPDPLVLETSATTPPLPLTQFASLAYINPDGLPTPLTIDGEEDKNPKKARLEFYNGLKERLGLFDGEANVPFAKKRNFVIAKAAADKARLFEYKLDEYGDLVAKSLTTNFDDLIYSRARNLLWMRLAQGNYIGEPPEIFGFDLDRAKKWAREFYRPHVTSIIAAFLLDIEADRVKVLREAVLDRYIQSLTEHDKILPGMSANIALSGEGEDDDIFSGEEEDEETSASVAERTDGSYYAFVCEPSRIAWHLAENVKKISVEASGRLYTNVPGIDLDAQKHTPLKNVRVKVPVRGSAEAEMKISLALGLQVLAASMASAASFSAAEWLKGGRRVLLLTPAVAAADANVFRDIVARQNLNTEPLQAIGSMPTLTVFLIVDENKGCVANVRPSGPAFGYPTVQVYVPWAMTQGTSLAAETVGRWLNPLLKALQLPPDVFVLTPLGARKDETPDNITDHGLFLLDVALALTGASSTRKAIYEQLMWVMAEAETDWKTGAEIAERLRDEEASLDLHEILAALPLGMSSFEIDAIERAPRIASPPPLLQRDLALHDLKAAPLEKESVWMPSLLELILARERRTLGMIHALQALEPMAVVDTTNRARTTDKKIWSDAKNGKKKRSSSSSKSRPRSSKKKRSSSSSKRSRSKSRDSNKKKPKQRRSSSASSKRSRSTSRDSSKKKKPQRRSSSTSSSKRSRSTSRDSKKKPQRRSSSASSSSSKKKTRSRSSSSPKKPSSSEEKKKQQTGSTRSRSTSRDRDKKKKKSEGTRGRSQSQDRKKREGDRSRSRGRSKSRERKDEGRDRSRSKERRSLVINLPNIHLHGSPSGGGGGGGGAPAPGDYNSAPVVQQPQQAPLPPVVTPTLPDPAAVERARLEQDVLELKREQERAKLGAALAQMKAEEERLAQLKAEHAKAEQRRMIEAREAEIAKDRAELEARRVAMEKEVADRVNTLEKQATPPAAAAVPAKDRLAYHGFSSMAELEDAIWQNSFIY